MKNFDWINATGLIFVHVACFTLGWWTWSLAGLVTMLILTVVTGMFGVCIGYHRLLTHMGFKTFPWVKRTFAFIGQMSGEGSAAFWVGMHRKHHAHSDQEGDPHSPVLGGFWWSHMGWMVFRNRRALSEIVIKYAPELYQDPFMRFMHTTFVVWHVVLAILLFAIGWLLGGWYIGLSMAVWGMLIRMLFVLHSTWFVNSATHLWGYRNYQTKDNSRNLWWVALLTFGEGWHNNHHQYQVSARHGHKWWEFDPAYWGIRLLELLGLAWDVKLPPEH